MRREAYHGDASENNLNVAAGCDRSWETVVQLTRNKNGIRTYKEKLTTKHV